MSEEVEVVQVEQRPANEITPPPKKAKSTLTSHASSSAVTPSPSKLTREQSISSQSPFGRLLGFKKGPKTPSGTTARITELEAELAKKDQELKAAREELFKARTEIGSERSKATKLNATIETLMADKAMLTERVAQVEEKNEKLSARLKAVSKTSWTDFVSGGTTPQKQEKQEEEEKEEEEQSAAPAMEAPEKTPPPTKRRKSGVFLPFKESPLQTYSPSSHHTSSASSAAIPVMSAVAAAASTPKGKEEEEKKRTSTQPTAAEIARQKRAESFAGGLMMAPVAISGRYGSLSPFLR